MTLMMNMILHTEKNFICQPECKTNLSVKFTDSQINVSGNSFRIVGDGCIGLKAEDPTDNATTPLIGTPPKPAAGRGCSDIPNSG